MGGDGGRTYNHPVGFPPCFCLLWPATVLLNRPESQTPTPEVPALLLGPGQGTSQGCGAENGLNPGTQGRRDVGGDEEKDRNQEAWGWLAVT